MSRRRVMPPLVTVTRRGRAPPRMPSKLAVDPTFSAPCRCRERENWLFPGHPPHCPNCGGRLV